MNKAEISQIKNQLSTLFAKTIETLGSSVKKISSEELLVQLASELVQDDWTDLGLGTVTQGKNQV